MGDPSTPSDASRLAAAPQPFDTLPVVNAVEISGVQLRNEGYIGRNVTCRLPHLSPTVGYAFTLRVCTSSPPMAGGNYSDRSDWWEAIEQVHYTGSFIGGSHAEILHALGCVGCITNGAVHDLVQAEARGFQLFAGNVTVSHAYTHIIAVGQAVSIDGLTIGPGDLLHGDVHGAVRLPTQIAAEVPAIAGRMAGEEKEIVHYCRQDDFSLEGLPHAPARSEP